MSSNCYHTLLKGEYLMRESEKLGQVFTSRNIAKLMALMIKSYLNKESKILDPCIGKNIFFEEISSFNNGQLVGVEIDSEILDDKIKKFYQKSNRKLIIGDFFDMDISNKFDVIIMNPPYIRQELLNSEFNSKSKMLDISNELGYNIPKNSNLYVYFIIKALDHLNKNGVLIAIIYDSWLFTKFGRYLKEIILDNYNLKNIIHFKHDAFDNVDIGATIILIQNKKNNGMIQYHSYNSAFDIKDFKLREDKCISVSKNQLIYFHEIRGNLIDLSYPSFLEMSSISNNAPNRGVNAIVNKYFLFEDDKYPPYTNKIIKSIKKINNFKVNSEYDYLLMLPKHVNDETILSYLNSLIKKVSGPPILNKSLMNKMESDKYWFHIKEKKCGNVIFNYYFRDNPHFIYNPNNYLVSDNFYSLYINQNLKINFCILNSTITKYSLYKYGKSQGRGLFKIQLEQFKKLPILNANKLDESSKEKLEKLCVRLFDTPRDSSSDIIREIDKILIKSINKSNKKKISILEIVEEIEKIKNENYYD